MATYVQDDDEDLVLRSIAGDTEAFENIVKKYKDQVYKLILSMGCLPEDAKGVTQGVFIQVFYSLPNFQHKAKFSTWLYRITKNRCYNWFKRNRLKTMEIPNYFPDTKNISPEEILLEREHFSDVRKAVYLLPEKYRKVVELFYFAHLSYSEIANSLKLNERTVESRLYRARKILKGSLQKQKIT
ncbi:MAG TPA: sigma-70 family RNA polymerase sigma factor [Clostridia bacterium]|nr:sigma-70 family RNA polymerase sigma factor [Clostridia bacterium]